MRLHPELVRLLIALDSRCPDTWSFGAIEHAELDSCRVRILTHRPTQSVDFSYYMAFPQTTNCRITGHLCHGVEILSQQQGGASEPSRGKGRFHSGMPAPDHRNIIFF
jgi:hypothetical protein